MKERISDEQAWVVTGALVVLAVVALGAALSFTRYVTVPFVLAIFITSLVSPLVDNLVLRLRFPRWIAVTATLAVALAVVASVGLIFVVAAQAAVQRAQEYSESFESLAERMLSRFDPWFAANFDSARLVEEIGSQLPRLAEQTAGTAFGLLSEALLVLVFVVFLVAGRDPYAIRQGVYAEIDSQIRKYLATKTAMSACTGLLVWAILAGLQLKMAFLFGVLAFLLNFIPSLGSVVATLLPMPVAIVQFDDPWWILAVLVLPGTVQITIGNFVEPKLLGRHLQLHPVTILLSLAFWGLLWGPAGMVLAVPIMGTVRIVLMRFLITRSMGRLLAGELPGERSKPLREASGRESAK